MRVAQPALARTPTRARRAQSRLHALAAHFLLISYCLGILVTRNSRVRRTSGRTRARRGVVFCRAPNTSFLHFTRRNEPAALEIRKVRVDRIVRHRLFRANHQAVDLNLPRVFLVAKRVSDDLEERRLTVVALTVENEQKFLWLSGGRAAEDLLEIGHELLGTVVFTLGRVGVATHDSIQERHELWALGVRIVTDANQPTKEFLRSMCPQHASSQVHGSVFGV